MIAVMRWAPLACVLGAVGACGSTESYRGEDRDALMPAVVARVALRKPVAMTDPTRVTYMPTLEGSATRLDGDFAQDATQFDYRASSYHVAFAPEITWQHMRFSPLAGLAYSDVEVDAGAVHARKGEVGIPLGIGASWLAWNPVEPYGRYVRVVGPDAVIGRFELGIDLRVTAALGFQLAYARQTSEFTESFLLVIPGDSVHVETEGLHLGLSLRF